MKTKLTILGIAAIAAGGLAGNHNQTEKPAASELTIVNIEALTADEWGYDTGCVANGDGCILRYNRWCPTEKPENY